jgi:hypothetical protein
LLTLETLLDCIKHKSITGAQSSCFHTTSRINNSKEVIIKCASSLDLIINDSNEEDFICNLAYRLIEKTTSIIIMGCISPQNQNMK